MTVLLSRALLFRTLLSRTGCEWDSLLCNSLFGLRFCPKFAPFD
jgi:hypothetical protein